MASSKSVPLSPEEIREHAERLREDFLRKHSENSNFDSRDINAVRNNINYVEKFVRHNRRHPENAMPHLMDCLSWRKSFGVNDIKFEEIDEALWRSAMAINHGFDRNGHNIVILNISKHKKDSKKALQLQRWIAFSFEMHQKVYPQNRMCMVFDMSSAGLSNMDMDLIRFIINCFKIYFPDLLEWLLIFNMPWILQAAWKIVQSWLSESGAARVKFVTTETIQEYIPLDNLLVKFGGNDPWEFDYGVEKEIMLNLLREVSGDSPARPADGSDDEVKGLSEEEMFEEEEYQSSDEGDKSRATTSSRDSLKQVRFSAGLPPSRQSRYGPEEDEEGTEFSSLPSLRHPDQAVLRKGSATTSGFRRRQVSRLMSLQETPQGRPIAREMNGSIPGVRHQFLDKTLMVGGVLLSPSHELMFHGEKEGDILGILTLKNIRDTPVAYKVKTTAPLAYKVRPNLAIIDPKSIAKIQVLLTQGCKISGQDKFLVQTYSFSETTPIPKMEELTNFWKTLPLTAISEHKMRCRLMSEIPTRPAIKTTTQSVQQKQTNASPGAVAASTTLPATNLNQKVQYLLDVNTRLERSVAHLQRLNYVVIILLIVIVIIIVLLK